MNAGVFWTSAKLVKESLHYREKSMIFERECTEENLTTCKVDDA